ncbi:MAG: hypothetical protein GNW80_09880 [Asgard group archaeon]|nr:hypothetical protein [Asgard group archaeon]
MSKKIRILMLINAIAAMILVSSISTAQAVPPGWNAGDIIVWGMRNTTKASTYEEGEDVLGSEVTMNNDLEYNVTALDTLNREFDAIETDASGSTFRDNKDYGAAEFVSDELDLYDFFSVNYVWDYVNNVSVCTSFDAYFFDSFISIYFLIEPDWAIINDGYVDMFNTSVVMDTLADPYQPIIYNYTLGDIIDAISMKIMGKNELSSAINQFTDTVRKWTFEFDLSGYIKNGQFNGTDIIYYDYEEYKIYVELEYTKEGVLDRLEYSFIDKITINDVTNEFDYKEVIAQGGMKAAAANFATFAAIGGLVSTALIAIFIKRKKK